MSGMIIFDTAVQQVHKRLEGETVWISFHRLAVLYKRDKSVISRYLKNDFDRSVLRQLLTQGYIPDNQRFEKDAATHGIPCTAG